MRKTVVCLCLIGCVSLQARAEQLSHPKIFIEYGSSLDLQICPHGIADVVLNEVNSRIPELQALWQSYEDDLLGATTELVRKPFLRKEETVTGLACPTLKAQAEPILIPIWPFLSSATNGHPFDQRFFIGETIHELLHRYIDGILGGMNPSTPLLNKYAGENLLVRRHLHVDAVQKAVYLRLGRTNEINAIIANDAKYFGPDYARAWEIVNQIEGFDAFIEELKK
jgi:hypothetical protein